MDRKRHIYGLPDGSHYYGKEEGIKKLKQMMFRRYFAKSAITVDKNAAVLINN